MMKLLDLTLPTPVENIALDEALLDQAEEQEEPLEVLRLWESPQPMVVIGRSSAYEVEAVVDTCEARKIPILRRCSGGAAIVAGPGCLMYAVVMSYDLRPELRAIDQAHRFVMQTIAAALRPLDSQVSVQGICDLTRAQQKFSGNALRCKRRHLLYHGTLLYDFDLSLITQCLGTPPRQPDYRRQRKHGDFVVNLPLSASQLRPALASAWNAAEPFGDWPQARTQELVAERYSQDAWNRRR